MTDHATELDAARAIASGDAPSPLQYENCWLYAIRITGTGISYRAGRQEYVFRDPGIFLTDEFAARCNGLPVILIHPEKGLLNADEYDRRNVGAIMFAYRKDDELWGVARLFDPEVVEALRGGELSTSPGVRFAPDEIATAQLDKDAIAIEGNPSLVDHIAVVPAGVWDKGGPPNGIRNDAMSETREDSNFSELVDKLMKEGHSKESATKIAAKVGDEKIGSHEMAERAAESRAHHRSDGKDEPMTDKVEGDGARQDAAKDLMDKLDAMCARMDAVCTRMDAMEADKKDGKRADADEGYDAGKDDDKKDAKRADASDEKEEKEREDKERDEKDAAIAAQNAALQAQIAAMQAKFDALAAPRSIEDMERLSAAQTRADGVLQLLGERPIAPLPGESATGYRKRVLAGLKKHSGKLKDIAVDALDGAALDTIEDAIFADAQAAARTPNAVRGKLIAIVTTDAAGRKITKYHGDPRAWRGQFDLAPASVIMPRPQGGIN
ncbi:MAG TPA: DUF2213 domain-containing protein [Acidiphilium sp.]|nr:DUF2213 domain-containing protein [Acidiphilium sp.]